MIRTWNPRTVTPSNVAFGGRLTLASGTPVTTTDQTAKTTVFYTPYLTNLVSVAMDGGSFYSVTTSELSLALDSNSGHTGYQQSGKNFDLFLYSDSGTLRLVSGPAWTNDTTRATSLTQLKGVYVNSGSMTAKFDASASTLTVADKTGVYVGTMRASADGQTADSGLARNTINTRYLVNYYNAVPRPMRANPGYSDGNTATTYTTTSTTLTEANSGTGSRCNFLIPVSGWPVALTLNLLASNSNANIGTYGGIGLDSATSAKSLALTSNGGGANAIFASSCQHYDCLAAGFHFAALLIAVDANTGTFYADAGRIGSTADPGITEIEGWILG